MLRDKVVVITGGAGLLGQEFASTVLEHSGISIIADLDEERSLKIVDSLKKLHPEGIVDSQLLDICNKNSILTLIENINKKYGRIDALVNNAYPRNKNYGRKFEDISYEDFCENLSLNLGGYFLTSQQFLNYYCNQGFGNIVNISSVYGVIPPRFEVYNDTRMTMPVEYAAIKSALIHMTKYMAKYFKGKNIRINSISLGGLFDGQPESFLISYKSFCLNKGMLNKDDVNGTLIYLLSDQSAFVNGQNIIVDDGFTL